MGEMLVQRTARSYGGLDISYETEFYVETKLRILGSSFARVLCVMPPKPFFRPGKQSQSMALCSVPSARGDDGGRHGGSPVDLAARVDSGGTCVYPPGVEAVWWSSYCSVVCSCVMALPIECVLCLMGAAIAPLPWVCWLRGAQ